jgi:hypothetical protein
MKNEIYMSIETYKFFEAKIDELQIFSPLETDDDFLDRGKQIAFEEILSSATILPVEDNWTMYPKGVIIKPK